MYNINATPTIIILNQKGDILFNYAGFIDAKKLIITMDFLNKPENQNLNEEQLANKLLKLYKDTDK